MKKETLEKANALTQEIKGLEEHIKRIESSSLDGFRHLIVRPNNSSASDTSLRSELLYIPVKAFMEVYLLSAKSHLEKLQKEFNDLKD